MKDINIGIVGFGHVGHCIFNKIPIRAKGPIKYVRIYDKDPIARISTKEEINKCNYVFICVPTPLDEKTGLLDISAVDEVLKWCTVKNICIKSTVPVGYTKQINDKYVLLDKDLKITSYRNIVFSPEYYGETYQHPYKDEGAPWLILGGLPEATKIFADLMQEWYPSTTKIHCTDSTTAELTKFMENAFLATKVTFCNTFYEIAEKFGVDYHKLREAWLLDPRIGESHTMVYPDNRGYGGKCLPKDIQSITTQAQEKGADTGLLQSVIDTNFRTKLPF